MRTVLPALALLIPLLAAAPQPADNDPTDKERREIVEQEKRREADLPLPLDRAAAAMTLPPGFSAKLVAGEPELSQPVALTIDHRGRLWVCENYSYPQWREQSKDRILILEDADGDGSFEKRTVFAEGMFHYLTGVAMGTGGVWVLDCPNLLFIPVNEAEGGDKPAGPPVVHLDGWNWRGKHNVPNTLTWGPDGWLYGCNGITLDHFVGPPGTPQDQRTRISCGIWRYHPLKKTFEHYAEGTTNPWGLDYNRQGQFFMSNNVVAHMWHVIQGAHYKRMHGRDFNPYVYVQIQTCADHMHWAGTDWTKARGGETNSALGGGHSHSGLAFYYGEAFPPEYRGTMLMCNTHGHRLNNDSVERKGSGYVARHRPDFLLANDKWFKGVSVRVGPDGAAYVIDWSDTGECHDVDITDRGHGRLYRVTYGEGRGVKVNLTAEPDEKLVAMQTRADEWYVRHARDVLRERAQSNRLSDGAKAAIGKLFTESTDPLHRLRGLWTMHQCGLADEGIYVRATADTDEYVRAGGVQFLAESKKPTRAALERFVKLAQSDASPVVRLYLAAAMQRTPVEQRWAVLEHLVAKGEDSEDQNLPCMYWYALEPVVGANSRQAATQILPKLKVKQLRELVVRRMASK